ncbi:MAG: hypothetical protein JXR88_12070 [Clostridia bacterium]|nr:hypothetical protein [Clostridia bacterium]
MAINSIRNTYSIMVQNTNTNAGVQMRKHDGSGNGQGKGNGSNCKSINPSEGTLFDLKV